MGEVGLGVGLLRGVRENRGVSANWLDDDSSACRRMRREDWEASCRLAVGVTKR